MTGSIPSDSPGESLLSSQWAAPPHRRNGNALLQPIANASFHGDSPSSCQRETRSMLIPSRQSANSQNHSANSGVLATRRRITELIQILARVQNGARMSEGVIPLAEEARAGLPSIRSFAVPSSRKAVAFDLEEGRTESGRMTQNMDLLLLQPARSSPHLDCPATGPHLDPRLTIQGHFDMSSRPFASFASFSARGTLGVGHCRSFLLNPRASTSSHAIALALAGVGTELQLSALQIAQIQEEPNAMPRWKAVALCIHSHRYFYAALVICTFYVIFEDDFKRAILPPSADLPLEIIISLITIFFVVEMIFGSLVKPGYFLGFYFTIDAIAISCLFFQVPNVKSSVLGINNAAPSLQYQGDFITEMGNLLFVFAKTALVAKIFRLLYLLRLFNLYERFETRRSIRKILMDQGFSREEARKVELVEMEIMNSETLNQGSRVGMRLQELTLRRVVFGVLLLILLLPGFDPSWGLWGVYVGVDRGGLQMLHQMALWALNSSSSTNLSQSPGFNAALATFQANVPYNLGSPGHVNSNIVSLVIANQTITPASNTRVYRYLELYQIEFRSLVPPGCNLAALGSQCLILTSSAVYDWRWHSQLTSILNIARSIFLILLFTLGVFFLNRDTQELVIKPVQRMLSIVQNLADNPLKAATQVTRTSSQTNLSQNPSESHLLISSGQPQSMIKRVGAILHSWVVIAADYFFNGHPSHEASDRHHEPKDETYETLILEQSMQKIGQLLAVGFGDAGAEIIAENMRRQGDLNPMVPGRRVASVFGFCDIRQFTDTTEVLQESIMEFVNTIAKIVHISVALHGGAANKNIGDAFLLAWKFPQAITMEDINSLCSQPKKIRSAAVFNHKPHLPLLPPPLDISFSPFSAAPIVASLKTAPPPARTFSRIALRKDRSILNQGSASLRTTVGPTSFLARASSLIKSNKVQPITFAVDGAVPIKSITEGQGGESEALRQLALMRSTQLKPAAVLELDETDKCSVETKEIVHLIADNALASFIIIQACLKRSERLVRYCNKREIQDRLGEGFRVKMGFGLHVGWAIEGAIGSEFKIDASYLSPNVNMASRLEAATKQYSVPLLLSGDFVSCLSPFVRERVRQIDRVTVKGSNQPVDLFTYDVTLDHIDEPAPSHDEVMQRSEDRVEEARLELMLQREFQDEWVENPDLADSWGITPAFKQSFDEGFQMYIEGEWAGAKEHLESLAEEREDGPIQVLLQYMAKYDFTAPGDWKGYRELTDK